MVQHFFNENRIRQAASSLGAAQFCINESIEYAKERAPFGKPLATNQGIQFPLVELQTQCEMLRALIHKTAWQMDTYGAFSVSDKVSMCNYGPTVCAVNRQIAPCRYMVVWAIAGTSLSSISTDTIAVIELLRCGRDSNASRCRLPFRFYGAARAQGRERGLRLEFTASRLGAATW